MPIFPYLFSSLPSLSSNTCNCRDVAMAAAALLLLLLAAPAAFAADYVVGGNSGWTLGGNYLNWASGKKFAVGDTLVFTYDSSHGVDQVSQADYNSCSTSNAIASHTDGNTSIPLSTQGPMYFICSTPGHCAQGMKLQINVGNGSTPSTPTTPSTSPSTPSTPASDSPPTTTGSAQPPPASKPSGVDGSACGMKHAVLGLSLALGVLIVLTS